MVCSVLSAVCERFCMLVLVRALTANSSCLRIRTQRRLARTLCPGAWSPGKDCLGFPLLRSENWDWGRGGSSTRLLLYSHLKRGRASSTCAPRRGRASRREAEKEEEMGDGNGRDKRRENVAPPPRHGFLAWAPARHGGGLSSRHGSGYPLPRSAPSCSPPPL